MKCNRLASDTMAANISFRLCGSKEFRTCLSSFILAVSASLATGCDNINIDIRPDQSVRWRTAFDAGFSAKDKGDLSTAESNYKEALHILEESKAEDDRVPQTLSELTETLVMEKRDAEAEAYAIKALNCYEKRWQPDGRGELNRNNGIALANAIDRLAGILSNEGRVAEAEVLYRRALKIADSGLATPKLTRQITEHYAFTLQKRGKRQESRALLKSTSDFESSPLILGDQVDQSMSVKQMDKLAKQSFEGGNYDNANKLYRAIIDRERRSGKQTSSLASALLGLSNVYDVQGKYSDAEDLVKEGLQIAEEVYGKDNEHVTPFISRLASIYAHTDKIALAETNYKRAIAIAHADSQGKYNHVERHLINSLSDIYLREHRYKEAEQLNESTIPWIEEAYGTKSKKVAFALIDHGDVLILEDKPAAAEKDYTRALAIFRGLSEGDPRDIVSISKKIAKSLIMQHRDSEAAKFTAQASSLEKELIDDLTDK